MRYLFLGNLSKKEDENIILKLSKKITSSAVNTFQWNLIDGLDICTDNNVDILNVLPVGVYPLQYKKLFLKTHKWTHKNGSNNIEIGSINIPFAKQLSRTLKIKKYIKKWIKKSIENKTIIIYGTYQPFLSAIKSISDDIKIIIIITDLPEFYDLGQKTSFIFAYLRKVNNKIIYNALNRVNYFVLLTSQMKDFLHIGNKPYVVMEGITVEVSHNKNINAINNKKIILYTGTLMYKYGIENLLKAFGEIKEINYELWICGSGEAENEIKKICETDKRIKYYGHVNKNTIYELQSQATILINPRTNEGEYTKYSFPSKTMEYMASGKPIVMYKLDGIPDEYDEYLYYVENNSIESLKNKIIEMCSKPSEELEGLGMKAREWILREKNNIIQAKKIIGMIERDY